MRTLLLAAALLCAVSSASAQTARSVAILETGTFTLLTERASFPRHIERGDVIVEFRLADVARRAFADAGPNEALLEHRVIAGDRRNVYCGAAGLDANAAAALPATRTPPRYCFLDSDDNGDADQAIQVTGETRTGLILGNTVDMSPRDWSEAPAAERRLVYRYGGPSTGRVLDNGRLGDGGVEINPSVVTDDVAKPAQPILLGCVEDGRCGPMPNLMNPIIGLNNPTVEGEVDVVVLTPREAFDTSLAVNAMIQRLRTTTPEAADDGR